MVGKVLFASVTVLNVLSKCHNMSDSYRPVSDNQLVFIVLCTVSHYLSLAYMHTCVYMCACMLLSIISGTDA
jgi:hypothetical protein